MGLKIGDLFQRGAIKVQRSWYAGEVNPTKTNQIRDVGVELELHDALPIWIASLPDRSDEGWVFASERIVTPLLPDYVLRHCIHLRLGLGWITFAVLRRSHSTLHQERGPTPKSLPTSRGTGWAFTCRTTWIHRSHVSRRHPRRFGRISRCYNRYRRRVIETNETRADSARRAKHRKHGAGGDTSTHGRQLGKLRPIVNRPTAALAPDSGGSQPPRRPRACPTTGFSGSLFRGFLPLPQGRLRRRKPQRSFVPALSRGRGPGQPTEPTPPAWMPDCLRRRPQSCRSPISRLKAWQ